MLYFSGKRPTLRCNYIVIKLEESLEQVQAWLGLAGEQQ